MKDVVAQDKAMEREAKLLRLYEIKPPDPAGKTLIDAVVAIARRKKGWRDENRKDNCDRGKDL